MADGVGLEASQADKAAEKAAGATSDKAAGEATRTITKTAETTYAWHYIRSGSLTGGFLREGGAFHRSSWRDVCEARRNMTGSDMTYRFSCDW